MREIYRDRDYSIVGYHQSVLEEAGIPTLVRNKDLVGMTTEVPIPDMFPALCVMDDEDYDRAIALLREVAPEREEAPMPPLRGVVLAGIILFFGMLLFCSALAFWMNWKWVGDPDPPVFALFTSAVGVLGSGWILVINFSRYLRERLADSPL